EHAAQAAVVVDQLERRTEQARARAALEMAAPVAGDAARCIHPASCDEHGFVARHRCGEPSLEQAISADRDAAHHDVDLMVADRIVDVGPAHRYQLEPTTPVVRPRTRHLDVEAAPAARYALGEGRIVACRAHAQRRRAGREPDQEAGKETDQRCCARASAGRAVQRPSHAAALGAAERSIWARGAQVSTLATFRSATVNAEPSTYSRPASAPSSTPSGFWKRSTASSAFFGSRC